MTAAAPNRYDFPEVGPARLKLRHKLLIAAFVLIVIVPTLFGVVLSYSFAGSLRQVTVSVTVQEQALGALGPSSGGDMLRTAFTGRGAEETAIVRQLVGSEDFFRTIRDQIDLSEIWPADRAVPYLPMHYDPDGPVERGHDFWRNMVSVNLGSRDQIIRISVTAFDQQSAERVLHAVRVEAERRLNVARVATLTAALAEAEKRLAVLREENATDRRALLVFRLQNRAIDPHVLAGLNSEFTNFLRSMLAGEEINQATAVASVGEDAELGRRSGDRMAAIHSHLDDPDASAGRIISADDVSRLIAEYQPLVTEAELSGLALRMAEMSIDHYQREMESAKIFLSSVTGGSMAAVRVFPQFGPTLLVVMIGSSVIWCMLLLTFYAVRDRK